MQYKTIQHNALFAIASVRDKTDGNEGNKERN